MVSLSLIWLVQKIQILSNIGTNLKPGPQMATQLCFECLNHSYSIFTSKCIFSLMVKADVQCMFNKPQNRLSQFNLNDV